MSEQRFRRIGTSREGRGPGPRHDAYLRAHYHGGLHQRGRVLSALMRQTGFPHSYIKCRARRLGLTMHHDRRPWTKEELETLERLLGKVSAATIAKRLKRTETSVVMKIKALGHSRRVIEGYTIHELEECLGGDHHKIRKWIVNGWLRDRLQGTHRPMGTATTFIASGRKISWTLSSATRKGSILARLTHGFSCRGGHGRLIFSRYEPPLMETALQPHPPGFAPPKNQPTIFRPLQKSSPGPGEQAPLALGYPARPVQKKRKDMTEALTITGFAETRGRQCSTALSAIGSALGKPGAPAGPSREEPAPD